MSYPFNAVDNICVYSGPEYVPPVTTPPSITTTNIKDMVVLTPPICKICKFYDRCKKFGTAILTLENCKKGLGIEEKSVKIRVKKKPRQ